MNGKDLKEIRTMRGISREKFAEMMGSSAAVVYRWETDKSKIGSIPEKAIIAEIARFDEKENKR